MILYWFSYDFIWFYMIFCGFHMIRFGLYIILYGFHVFFLERAFRPHPKVAPRELAPQASCKSPQLKSPLYAHTPCALGVPRDELSQADVGNAAFCGTIARWLPSGAP